MVLIVNDEFQKQLEKKFERLNEYGKLADGLEESHRVELCITAINTLIYLGYKRKEILPYSFENFQVSLEEYLRNYNYLIDDVSYLICASFLKEYYLYRKRIHKDGFEDSDVFRVWNGFKELDIPISRRGEVFNFEFYKELKRDDSAIDAIYFCLSMQNSLFVDFNQEVKDYKSKFLNEIHHKGSEASKIIDEKKRFLDLNLIDFERDVKSLSDETKRLENTLKAQVEAFNFVGLSKGFKDLLSKKNSAKWTSFTLMIIVFLLLVLVPVLFIGGRFLNWFSEYHIAWNEIGWEQMLPILGLELLFVYFFRVVLSHYNSIQTQIMQLELRQSLCQFIQNYADYAKDIKEKDGASLEKFESLIFSSILSSADKVPSTFDGLEQMSNLIKNIRSGN